MWFCHSVELLGALNLGKTITIDVRMIRSSGIGTYISNVVPLIVSQMRDCDFYLLGHQEEMNGLENNKPNVHMINCTSSIYSISEQFELKKKIPTQTDLFWSPHYNIPLFYNGKLLVTVHDVFHLAMKEFVHGMAKQIYSKYMFHSVKRKADKIITVSNFTKSELLKYVGCNPRNILVSYNGVGASWFSTVEGKRFIDKPYLIYVGNVKPHKNLYSLIRAFGQLKDLLPHHLLIVGKKDGFLTGDEQINEFINNNNDRIHFTGFINDGHLRQYVHQADLFVFPSLYEGFGLPPLEAMASGTAVAVSNIPVLKEVCGDAACYFNPKDEKNIADTIFNLVKDNDMKNRLIQKGIKRAASYTWVENANNTEKIIRDLLKSENKYIKV